MPKRTTRPQTPKGDREMMRAFQELRQGSRTSPIPSRTAYKRPKAGSRNKEW